MTPQGDVRVDVESLLNDPPEVNGLPASVWTSEKSCYRFIADNLPESGATTLETGVGVSTIIFAMMSGSHTSLFLGKGDADRVVEHCRSRGISTDGLRLIEGSSADVLPTLDVAPLDLLFIDGGHGFPLPTIDWFYGARHLKPGGVLVLDDTQLAATQDLTRFLDQDARWQRMDGSDHWVAYRRLGEGSVEEEWTGQQFYAPLEYRLDRAKRRTRHWGRRIKGVFKKG